MLVLGLDPSLTNYGWAVHDTLTHGVSKCVDRGRYQTSAKMQEICRYMTHRQHVQELIQRYHPDKIAIEYPVFGELYSSGMYGLFLYSLEACYHTHSDVVFLSNTQRAAWVRRYLDRPSGWGQIQKSDVIEAAKKHTGGGRWSGDEADAYIISILGGKFWGFQMGSLSVEDLTEYERKLITEIVRPLRGKNAGKAIQKGLAHREGDRWFRFSSLADKG